MNLAPGIEMLETSFGDRPLNLVLFVGATTALVDSGLAGMPAAFLPQLDRLSRSPRDIALVINTHAHADHIGGNYELWLASGGQARFAAHRLEREWIETPASQSSRNAWGRYVALGVVESKVIEDMIETCGRGVRIDHVLEGGERFPLGSLEIEILACPGHSPGNLSVFERTHGVLVHGESVGGDGQYGADGRLLTVPFYGDVEDYLRTLAQVARIPFNILVSSHLPPVERREAADLLAKSLDFTVRIDHEVQARAQATAEFTVRDLSAAMDQLWGRYPADFGMYLLVETYLRSLLGRGLVSGTLEGTMRWRGGPDASGPDALIPLVEAVQEGIDRLRRG